MSERIPEHATRIERPERILGRIAEMAPRTADLAADHIMAAVDIDRDQIRRALGLALIGEAEMPRECLARVREVLAKIGGPL